jgi:hypothetical protein
MTPRTLPAIGAVALSLMALALPASAQTAPGNPWRHGTTLDLFGGAVAAPSSDTRGALGGSLGWEINRRVEIEGAGTWVIARTGDQAFTAELKAMVNLTRPNAAVPFVGAGVGMYRATFDATSGPLPPFYQQRVSGPSGLAETFTDPSLVFTGGLNILTGRHVSVRPEASVRLVLHASDSYAVTMVAVHAIFHFEEHVAGR